MKNILHRLGFCDWEQTGAFRKCKICGILEHYDSTPYSDGHWEYVGHIPEAVEDYNKMNLLRGKNAS